MENTTENKTKETRQIKSDIKPTWCPGCGNFGIWNAFEQAARQENWDNTNTVLMAGIGCHGHIVNFLNLTAFEGLHGRALPTAAGIKMANHELNVFVFSGDGDCLSEGGNHFLHTCRRNHNLTLVLHDNAIYALTTGQTSPASPIGQKSKSTPEGNIDEPLKPLKLAYVAGATFLARVYANNIADMKEILIAANNHKGFSVVEVLQPCVTFNIEYSHHFFQNNIYKLDASYDPTNEKLAWEKLNEWGEKQIPVGILYKKEIPCEEDKIKVLNSGALIKNEIKVRDISDLYSKFQ